MEFVWCVCVGGGGGGWGGWPSFQMDLYLCYFQILFFTLAGCDD